MNLVHLYIHFLEEKSIKVNVQVFSLIISSGSSVKICVAVIVDLNLLIQ